jgi:lipoate-protein ligase A
LILWVDGDHDAAENMRRDERLLARAAEHGEPVLRLFAFAPPGITLGHGQSPERELDLERCAADGIAWALRPTGGRAILHAHDWSYSLSAPLDDRDWGGTASRAYARASALIVASLNRLGVPAAFAPGVPRAAAGPRRGIEPCFTSTARHEIVLHGRKLVGSAQRRTARAMLQQGSVLLGEAHAGLVDYLALSEPRRREVRERLRMGTAHAGDFLGATPPLARWGDALLAELPPGSTRHGAADGLFLLTLSKNDFYTRAPSPAEA